MTNKKIEFTTLRELKQDLGLVLEMNEINEVLEKAKPGENKFFIGTNVKNWLESFNPMTSDRLEELFNNYDDESEVTIDNALDARFEVILHDNSYNWSGNSNCDIDYKILQDDFQNVYAYVRVHCGGDVRGNYTDGIILDLDTYHADSYTFFENIHENGESAYFEHNGETWSIDGNITSEYLSVYNHTTHKDYEICASVYEFSKEEFEKECIEVIKQVIAQ